HDARAPPARAPDLADQDRDDASRSGALAAAHVDADRQARAAAAEPRAPHQDALIRRRPILRGDVQRRAILVCVRAMKLSIRSWVSAAVVAGIVLAATAASA